MLLFFPSVIPAAGHFFWYCRAKGGEEFCTYLPSPPPILLLPTPLPTPSLLGLSEFNNNSPQQHLRHFQKRIRKSVSSPQSSSSRAKNGAPSAPPQTPGRNTRPRAHLYHQCWLFRHCKMGPTYVLWSCFPKRTLS